VILDERAFRNLDLDTNGAVALDEWQRFDMDPGTKENFSTLDDTDDGHVNVTEFLTQAPKHSGLYHFLGDAEQTNNNSLWEQQEFQPQGLQLFSIRF